MRFPVSVALVVAAAALAQWPLGEGYVGTARALTRYDGMVATNVLPLVAGALAALAASLFAESRDWPRPRNLIAAVVGGAVGFCLLKFNGPLQVYFGAALPAIGGSVLVAPYLRRGSRDAFWHWLFRMAMLGLRIGALALIAGALLSLILLALDRLAGFDVGPLVFVRVWAFVGLFLAPLAGLALIPRNFDSAPVVDLDAFAFGPVRTVLDWIAAPFLLLYALLLHIYAARILLSGAMPEGEIGMFALIFSVVLVAAVVILRPLRRSVRLFTTFLLRWWPFLLATPILLLLVAGLARIGDQGVTPARYLFVLGALSLAVIVALQFWRRARNDIRLIVIVPVLALGLASFGPWGALGRAIPSQAARFNEIVARRPLSEEDVHSARSILLLLDRYDALAPITPEKMPAADSRGQTFPRARIAAAYGLDR